MVKSFKNGRFLKCSRKDSCMARRKKPEHRPLQERTTRNIADLTPHPRQDEWFAPLNTGELEALAASIDRGGLQHPVHILPSNVILSGHQRIAAAKLLGWQQIDVVIRHDLAGDETAAAMFALTDNVNRRQMGPLEMALAYRALLQIERKNRRERCYGENRMDLRDRLAVHFGRSGRQLDRFVRLLDLPPAVRLAISQRRLAVSAAEQLFQLSEPKRREAAELIELGEDPKAVIRRFVPNKKQRSPSVHLQKPGLAQARANMTAILKFLSSHFHSYERYVRTQVDVSQESIDVIDNARRAMKEMVQYWSRYVRDARQLS
jgi:ParB/RepB/Spo0J family partition protein